MTQQLAFCISVFSDALVEQVFSLYILHRYHHHHHRCISLKNTDYMCSLASLRRHYPSKVTNIFHEMSFQTTKLSQGPTGPSLSQSWIFVCFFIPCSEMQILYLHNVSESQILSESIVYVVWGRCLESFVIDVDIDWTV